MSKKRESGLTELQERFCQEYLKDLNATQAAARAGYSEKTANEQGSRLLANVSVASRVQELMDARSKKTGITSERVLNEIAEIGFYKIDADGIIEDLKKLAQENIDPRSLPRIGTQEKLKALELLGKHLKLFTDKHEHSGPDGGPITYTDHERAAKVAMILNAARDRKNSSK